MNILVASDLSHRSQLALQRGVEIARNIGVVLPVLYVIDEDLPQKIQTVIESGARAEISDQMADLAPDMDQGEILVRTGGISAAILAEIDRKNIELLVMGGNRRQKQNVFTGTTIERVIRARRAPVLCVKNPVAGTYKKILVALDLTEATSQMLQTGERLELFANKNVILAHAFTPISGDLLDFPGVQDEARRRRYIATQEEALARLSEINEQPELQTSIVRCIAAEGKPYEVIRQLVESQQPDLIVMGTQGPDGLRRWLLGSVTEQALRELDTDMLIIPVVDAEAEKS